MSAPTQHDEARAVYHRCRLGKSELNRLFNLAPEGIAAAAVTISTQRNSTRYTANTLTDLVDHVRNSNAGGNLEKWENLSLEAADTAGDRKITISCDTERTEFQASGNDATWVHGQAARLERFLTDAGGEKKQEDGYKFLRKQGPWMALFAIALYASMDLSGRTLAPEVMKSTKSAAEQLKMTMALLVGAAPIALAWVLGHWIVRRANRALLQPTTDIPQGSWWSRATNADKIALAALGVGILSFFVALATLGKDLMK
ncbi:MULTISPECIES: hypothetical protein [Streptomyces]|uniref:Uncharacterized protein n=1 Tax=Streptomyces viridochromogenes TaxID=1938 RepID=A0A0L8JK09_STRVR|nr:MULTISPECIES: hypothetical protein [Streptomyces]KOG13973.1 hypothetical protein ADK34_29820 [Streptomyces viridochromogenes]